MERHAIVTSPPYPNRHDYSRAYGVELAVALAGPEQLLAFRRQQIHSHPEASPSRDDISEFILPSAAEPVIVAAKAQPRGATRQFIPRLAYGYAVDMWLCLMEIARVLRFGGLAAIAVGNVSYAGVEYPTDLIVAELAMRAGLAVESIEVARRRSVSPQQVLRTGPGLLRESVVVLRR